MALRILLVESNDDNSEMLTILFGRSGHSVVTLSNGEAALAYVSTNTPDVIFSSLRLPGMHGFELAAKLRQLPNLEKCVIFALTGYNDGTTQAKALMAGFDHFLLKPVSLDVMMDTVTALATVRLKDM